ncbi:DedA family protein [Rhodocytophaga rosea]|uniref:DedA family protein n=1 Tax=Rhodocytophaga rosea TaxID=2704465 RepID=A0A6C0GUX8_9BACT|nr:DedA family protein [Rhodocytophaga rosea]QHT71614.1 DedA family protein [Rhodocytophaga rosea]
MTLLYEILAILPDNESLIQWGGLALIAALVFIETGLLIGLIVPGGETLLFTAGLLCGTQTLNTSLFVLIICLIGAALAGDSTGYFIGRKLGKRLHHRKDSLIFKKRYLLQAEDFYKKNGKSALILGKFIPIIRTFNPLVSGTSRMEYHIFIMYALIACILYIGSLVTAGYFLGQQFPQIKDYIGYILPVLVILLLIPVIVKFVKERKKASQHE